MVTRLQLLAVLGISAAALQACGRGADAGDPSASANVDAAPAIDYRRGELLSLACQACHTLGASGPDLAGPNLHGVFGRRVATQPDFMYSEALRAADLVWTPAALDAWLTDPAGFIPGNNMAFTGYQSPRDRRDLIAFLVRATGADPAAEPD